MEYLARRRGRIDRHIETVVADLEPPELASQVCHAVLAGGKRVRPSLTLLTCELVGGDPDDAMDFAVGIELVHTASLIVDDIIDRSPTRRGIESSWSAFGHGPAIVDSDAHLGEAFALFETDPRAMQIVAEALVELGEGEASELIERPTTEASYLLLARRKTGALFRAAAELGTVAAEADPISVEAVGEYAERVGIAFQIRDDVLDATADSHSLGKPTGQDDALGRPSLLQVTELSPAAANRRAQEQVVQAIEALDRVAVENDRAYNSLVDLADYVVERER